MLHGKEVQSQFCFKNTMYELYSLFVEDLLGTNWTAEKCTVKVKSKVLQNSVKIMWNVGFVNEEQILEKIV